MTKTEMQAALERICKGERATLIVKPENKAEAEKLFAALSPRFQALLTLKEKTK